MRKRGGAYGCPAQKAAVYEGREMFRVICGSHHDCARRFLNSIPLLSKDGPRSEIAFMAVVSSTKNVIDLVHEDNCWPLCWSFLEFPKLGSHREDGSDYFLCLSILFMPQQVSGYVQKETLVLSGHYLQNSVCDVPESAFPEGRTHRFQNTQYGTGPAEINLVPCRGSMDR